MIVKNIEAVIAGTILVVIALIMAVVVITTVVPVQSDGEVVFPSIAFDGPVFVPVEGTDGFAFAGGNYTAVDTAIFTHCGITVYGTLYVADTGAWIIVDPAGHIPAGGSESSIQPQKVVQEAE